MLRPCSMLGANMAVRHEDLDAIAEREERKHRRNRMFKVIGLVLLISIVSLIWIAADGKGFWSLVKVVAGLFLGWMVVQTVIVDPIKVQLLNQMSEFQTMYRSLERRLERIERMLDGHYPR